MKTTFISNRQFQVRGTNFESFKGMGRACCCCCCCLYSCHLYFYKRFSVGSDCLSGRFGVFKLAGGECNLKS